jgi:hypothetical protein
MQSGQIYYDNSAVSDIFDAMSNGGISGKWGHGAKYYNKHSALAPTEIFANLHELSAGNDNNAIEFVRSFFLDIVKVFETWLYNRSP